jgi:hypothetical protein
MVPRTFPSSLNTFTKQRQLVAFFLPSVSGLQRWSDYIPVNFGTGTTLAEGSYNNNGFIAIQEITSTVGLQSFLDYIPVFFDSSATDAWRVSAVGFIPYGLSGITSPPSLELIFTRSNVLDSRITFTRSTSATFFNSAGVLTASAINSPRFDYNPSTLAPLGLLIEEQRTNFVRNNTGVGVVAGAPGTAPTNWNIDLSGSVGISREIVGSGSDNGISYVDIRLSGTCATTSTARILLDSTTGIAATASQGWAMSSYVKVQGGTLPSLLPFLEIYEYSSAPAYLRQTSLGTFTPTTSSLSIQRFTGSLTTGASTAYVRPSISVRFAAGVASDITLRIGLPQMEQAAYSTSAIPTTTVQVTRTADVATMTGTNFTSWYNASEGTMLWSASTLSSLTASQSVALGKYPTAWNISGGTGSTNVSWYGAGVELSIAGTYNNQGTVTALVLNKYAMAVANTGGQSATSLNGATASNRSGTTFGVGHTTFTIGNNLNGTIRSIVFYPRKLANTEIQALTL